MTEPWDSSYLDFAVTLVTTLRDATVAEDRGMVEELLIASTVPFTETGVCERCGIPGESPAVLLTPDDDNSLVCAWCMAEALVEFNLNEGKRMDR